MTSRRGWASRKRVQFQPAEDEQHSDESRPGASSDSDSSENGVTPDSSLHD